MLEWMNAERMSANGFECLNEWMPISLQMNQCLNEWFSNAIWFHCQTSLCHCLSWMQWFQGVASFASSASTSSIHCLAAKLAMEMTMAMMFCHRCFFWSCLSMMVLIFIVLPMGEFHFIQLSMYNLALAFLMPLLNSFVCRHRYKHFGIGSWPWLINFNSESLSNTWLSEKTSL